MTHWALPWSTFLAGSYSITHSHQRVFSTGHRHQVQCVLYMLIDSGANTHIINVPNFLQSPQKLSNSAVGSLFGQQAYTTAIGSLPIQIGDLSIIIRNVRYSVTACTSCLGLVALKKFSSYSHATHEINEFLTLTDTHGVSTTISK